MDVLYKILNILQYNPKEPMIFSSGIFLALFVVFTLLYMALRKKLTARLLFVTLFSYYFYYKSSGLYFFLLGLVTVSDYYIANAIARRKGNKKAQKWLIALSMVIDLGLLSYFKYTNFLAGMISQAIGNNFQPWDIFLPVGISFFTFQSMSYTIDVYRGTLKPLPSLLDYAFYVSFFPQLVAGPIVRASDFVPQIRKPLCITPDMFARGVYFVLIGLFKKAVISDYISLNFVDRIFDNPALFSGGEILLGLYGYSIQIYCDFSGYSDMAIGIALLLGFRFPINFNAPFKADSLSDFWRRWHISLSSWIRDYVYISLGGSRVGKVRMYVNQMIAMTLCGLWHGASLNFVIWGAVHGALVCIHKFFSQVVMRHERHYHPAGIRRFFAVIITFHLLCLTWILFRNQDFTVAYTMFDRLFTKFEPELLPRVIEGYKYVFMMIAFAFITHWLPSSWEEKIILGIKKGGVVVAALLVVAVIYLVIQVKSSEVQPFIYFQF